MDSLVLNVTDSTHGPSGEGRTNHILTCKLDRCDDGVRAKNRVRNVVAALLDLPRPVTAESWQCVIEGEINVTMFGSRGRHREEKLKRGDVGYIPQGSGHSIENVGKRPCRVLIGVNTGRYAAIDLSQWIAGNPAQALSTNFGTPESLFETFLLDRVFIAPAEREKRG